MYRRKRTVRRKRTYRPRRRFNITRRGSPRKPILKCRRFHTVTLNGSDTIPDTENMWTFSLADLPNYTEFTHLFDRYRITGVKYRWVLHVEPTGNAITTQTYRGTSTRVGWVHDYDDDTPTTNLALHQYPNFKDVHLSADKMVSKWYFIRPATTTQVYGNTVDTAYAPNWRDMIDCNSPGTKFYGLKFNIDNMYAGQRVELEMFYYIKLTGMR